MPGGVSVELLLRDKLGPSDFANCADRRKNKAANPWGSAAFSITSNHAFLRAFGVGLNL